MYTIPENSAICCFCAHCCARREDEVELHAQRRAEAGAKRTKAREEPPRALYHVTAYEEKGRPLEKRFT
jgi:hypothetical protein